MARYECAYGAKIRLPKKDTRERLQEYIDKGEYDAKDIRQRDGVYFTKCTKPVKKKGGACSSHSIALNNKNAILWSDLEPLISAKIGSSFSEEMLFIKADLLPILEKLYDKWTTTDVKAIEEKELLEASKDIQKIEESDSDDAETDTKDIDKDTDSDNESTSSTKIKYTEIKTEDGRTLFYDDEMRVYDCEEDDKAIGKLIAVKKPKLKRDKHPCKIIMKGIPFIVGFYKRTDSDTKYLTDRLTDYVYERGKKKPSLIGKVHYNGRSNKWIFKSFV